MKSILNQIPNATNITFLNNSKPTECRLIPFKPWLEMCLSFNFQVWTICVISCACIHFLSYGTPFRKIHKKKVENNLFWFCVTLCKCFVFIICRHFTTVKWLKVLKYSKIYWKMPWRQKTTDQNILFNNEWITFNLHCRLNECGIKLLILINNYF